jgi:predicted lipoprotein with Yx(FWY)xxD motif
MRLKNNIISLFLLFLFFTLGSGEMKALSKVMLTHNSKYGNIITDGVGRTLYFFTKDKDTSTSVCNGGCAEAWPVFYGDSLIIGGGLEAEDFGTIMRSDGLPQTTYKGWPLYYYAGDTTPGDVAGENVGGVWFVAKPDYTIMLMNNQLVGNNGVEYNSQYQPGKENVQYFVDGYGRTLYIFNHDSYSHNNFTKADFSNNGFWPIFEETRQSVPSIIDTNLFGTADVFGHKQLTYKGWPLYYFGPDSLKRGNTKGVSVPLPGVWPVAQISIKDAPKKVMLTHNSKYGNIITDGNGKSLYFFTKDKDTSTSVCNGGCATIWPVFIGDSLVIGPGLDAEDFGKIIRSDGQHQTTFKGWPLYYYSGDAAPGDVNGENVAGVWFVAKADYTIMLMNNQLVGNNGVEYNSQYQPGKEVVQYFVDGYGRTLYIFTHDTYNHNSFTKADFSNNGFWPIFEETRQSVPSIIDTNLFGTADVFGHKQLTYKGWPLYHFGPDSLKRGNTKGVSVPLPGVWPVAQITESPAQVTGVNDGLQVPLEYSLAQNYPNPFNPSTTIKFSIKNSEKVSLKIYNSVGQLITELVNSVLPAGSYNLTWNAGNIPSGIYLYALSTDNFRQSRKMILLK